jgi:hypothetical protein
VYLRTELDCVLKCVGVYICMLCWLLVLILRARVLGVWVYVVYALLVVGANTACASAGMPISASAWCRDWEEERGGNNRVYVLVLGINAHDSLLSPQESRRRSTETVDLFLVARVAYLSVSLLLTANTVFFILWSFLSYFRGVKRSYMSGSLYDLAKHSPRALTCNVS